MDTETVLHTLYGIIIDSEPDFIRAYVGVDIPGGQGWMPMQIRDKPAFEAAEVLEPGSYFAYQVCQSGERVYGRVVAKELPSEFQPPEIDPILAGLIKRAIKREEESVQAALRSVNTYRK